MSKASTTGASVGGRHDQLAGSNMSSLMTYPLSDVIFKKSFHISNIECKQPNSGLISNLKHHSGKRKNTTLANMMEMFWRLSLGAWGGSQGSFSESRFSSCTSRGPASVNIHHSGRPQAAFLEVVEESGKPTSQTRWDSSELIRGRVFYVL